MKSVLHIVISLPRLFLSFAAVFLFVFSSYTAKSQVIFSVGNDSGAQNVAVDVTVENFSDIIAFQFGMEWDVTYLSFDSVGNFGLPNFNGSNFNLTIDEVLLLSWLDPTLNPVSVPDGTVIFTLYFEVLQEGYVPVDITGNTIPIEVTGDNTMLLPFEVNGGFVNGIGTILTGNVFHDINDNCTYQTGEVGLNGWIIKFNGDQNFYTSTDENGDYTVFADTGDYVIELAVPNTLWQACTNPVSINIPSTIDTVTLDFPVQSVADCELMSVDISTPLLRRCFDNNYYVEYCNIGTATATDPYIEIEFDEYLSVLNSSAPFTISPEGLYVFELDDLGIGECGSFVIEAYLDCDSTVLGQTHCVSAHAYPDSLCAPPPNPIWSGASLQVNGECVNDEVQLTIRNIGDDMTMESQYIVIEDAVMHNPNSFQLVSGATMPLMFPANGSTYRLEVNQVVDHPGNSMPSLVIEGCGTNDGGDFSIGFATQFSEDDNDPWVSIDCQENIGAYDPNDKATSPEGYGPSHFIKPNIDIEYKIRFQNTGTDTAFNVVVEDSLSLDLDPTTLRVGTSSHPYDFELTDQGLMRFTFNNIMLPDSNVNEAASHGFVKFKIAQANDLPDGTVLHNEAAIYFDFNDAVWTNNTFLEVQRDFIPVSTQEIFEEGIEVNVYPNPFSETTTFEVKGKEYKALELRVFDSVGRLLLSKVHNSQPFEFSAGGVDFRGLYFYQILSEGMLISTGKLIKQ